MILNNKSVAVAGVACLLAARLLAQAPQAMPVASPANDTARLLAGLLPSADSALVELAQDRAWQQHAKFFDTAWANLERNQLVKVRAWAKTQVPDAFAAKGTVFYMFSGPDFLYADTFFPQARTYVLCGIEPIGPLPDAVRLAPHELGSELRALRDSLDSVLSFSFFITKEMKTDLRNHSLSGTLPLLYIFLARSGKTLCDVSYVSLDANGVLTARQDATRSATSPAPGVRISFVAEGSNTPRTLYYFSTDISDAGLRQSGFLKFCQTLAPANSCVKSASYLMHESGFSTIRGFLLENTRTLVQDDSGIPCAYFTPDAWQMRVFGSYPGPIPLFRNYRQPLLAEYYRTTHPPPLDFGIGYRHHAGESTLMVATHKPHHKPAVPPRALPVEEPPPQAVAVPVGATTSAARP
ncbi:MAG: hypothetical protein NTW21_25700 [Verrucomicrobia bacterium]|nr:hypothetical protein [Verrucomicrobiota bacterium]